MEHGRLQAPGRVLIRVALLAGLFIFFTLASYRVATAFRGGTRGAAPAGSTTTPASAARNPFESGRYLVAYVLVSSGCGYSTEKLAKQALRVVPDSLRAVHGKAFAKVSVVGVALDEDVGDGIRFLNELGMGSDVFDEISVGQSWLNEQVVRLAWREGMAAPLLPQVVLVERQVDARAYPRHIETQSDSVILSVMGRNDIIAWVGEGVPLAFAPKRRLTQ